MAIRTPEEVEKLRAYWRQKKAESRERALTGVPPFKHLRPRPARTTVGQARLRVRSAPVRIVPKIHVLSGSEDLESK